jgi:hypothetical protein
VLKSISVGGTFRVAVAALTPDLVSEVRGCPSVYGWGSGGDAAALEASRVIADAALAGVIVYVEPDALVETSRPITSKDRDHAISIDPATKEGWASVLPVFAPAAEDTSASVAAGRGRWGATDGRGWGVVRDSPNPLTQQATECAKDYDATWGLVRTSERDLDLSSGFGYDAAPTSSVDAYVIDTGVYLEHADFDGP